MHPYEVFQLYNLFLGGVSAAGFVYLLVNHRSMGSYRRFVHVLVLGVLIFALGGPLVDILAPSWSHAVHVVSTALVLYGLYSPIRNDLRRDEWANLLLTDPREVRQTAGWMVPMDDAILELFVRTNLVLSPNIIAYNTGYSREEVNRRLAELTERGLLDREKRGKYRITDFGRQYLSGQSVSGEADRDAPSESLREGD